MKLHSVLTFPVDQKLWQVEELRDELLHVSHGLKGGESPRGVHGVERAVRNIKALICLGPNTEKQNPFIDYTQPEHQQREREGKRNGERERERVRFSEIQILPNTF